MTLTNDSIITALLTNDTNAAAASELGISESYLYKRMKSDAFQRAFSDAKAVIFAKCLEQAQRMLLKSVSTMAEIMDDINNAPQVRLNAAQAIITTVTRLQSAAAREREENSPYNIIW
ncbi:MAG: hypothetical protein K5771_03105 [Oscillospiraceae bacterium]|nr:hypothetical protein [Oscillospiraceae bacterium]